MKYISTLLIEDDYALAQTIIDYLELENIHCDYADNGVHALKLLQDNTYHTIILDINLPRLNGFLVCERARNLGNSTPIIMLTAKDRLEDKLMGFKVGADDYLIKPFAMDELVARLRVLSGRKSTQAKILTVADLVLDIQTNTVTRAGEIISLSPTGFILLKTLMSASPYTVSKEELINEVWGENDIENNSLKVHIHKLRTHIDKNHNNPLIHTIKTFGYAVKEQK